MRAQGVVMIFMLLIGDGAAAAQEIRATVTGHVIDQQGAVLPGVTVTAVNIDTNVSPEAVTSTDGGYTISQLQPGPYRLTAALPGFKTFIREGITLHTADTARVEIQLSLGTLEETITVVAALTTVETNQSTLAQTMENKRVSELPLNGRQVYQLLQLTSGTQFTQTTFGSTGFSGRAHGTPPATSRFMAAGPATTSFSSTAHRTPRRVGGSTRRRSTPSRSSRSRPPVSTPRMGARAAAS